MTQTKTPKNIAPNTIHQNEFQVPSRYLILIWIAPLFYLPGFDYISAYVEKKESWYWFDLSYYYYFHYLCIIALFIMTFVYKIQWQQMLKKPQLSAWQPSILLTIYTFIFSTAGAYLLFYPLSFTAPEFVNAYYINIPPIVYVNQTSFPIIANLLSLLSLSVFAPIIEELVFRGLLLHRFAYKWGKTTAIVLSSIIFAILHPDPIGAFAFGVAMCCLYLKYKTLVVPIVCHGLYNLAVWCIELILIDADTVTSPVYLQTLSEFQANLWIGVVCGVACYMWGAWYLKYHDIKNVWAHLKIPNITQNTDTK